LVQVQLLNDNLQKWITMESVAVAAKQQLVMLTSREGDWYLDEMSSLIGNCAHLMRLASLVQARVLFDPLRLDSSFKQASGVLVSLDRLFGGLKDLVNEFPLDDLMAFGFDDPNRLAQLLAGLNAIDTNGFFEAVSREGFQQFEFLSVSWHLEHDILK